MLRIRSFAGGAAVLALVAALAACSDEKDLVNPPPPVDALFRSYVALGNSITAGFQSGGINDSTQREAYPVLVAAQMKTRFAVPLLKAPGCPPPIDNFLTLHRVQNGTSTTCALRSEATGTAVINDVAVPGATSFDPTAPTTPASNTLTTLILGGKTQVGRALDADPTFASVWIGNNDVLSAALTGILTATQGVSPGVTDTTQFVANYHALIQALTAAPRLRGGVLIGVVNVSGAPIFFSARALFNPQVKGAVDQVAGRTVTVDTSCTPSTPSLVNFLLLPAIRQGTAPDTIACHPLANHTNLLGDLYVLDGGELTRLQAIVGSYNAHIKAIADSLHWAYVDPNEELGRLRQQGAIPPFPDLTHPEAPFGPYISVDGIHPAAAAHRRIADIVIDSVNAKFGTSIPNLP